MKIKYILIAVVVASLIAGVAIALAQNREEPPAPVPTDAVEVPMPEPTSEPTATPDKPNDTPDEPGDAADGGGNNHGVNCDEPGPVSCAPPGEAYNPTDAQFAATAEAATFASQFLIVDPSETPDARAARLEPLVATGSTAASQPTVLARSNSGRVGMEATVTVTGKPFSLPVRVDENGNWVFYVFASFHAVYQEPAAPATVWNASGTWTVTLNPTQDLKVVSVSESVPIIEGL